MATKLPQFNTTLKPEWRQMFDEMEAETGFADQAVVKAILHAVHRRWTATRDWPARLPADTFGAVQAAAEDPAPYAAVPVPRASGPKSKRKAG